MSQPANLERLLRVSKNQRAIMFCILGQLGVGGLGLFIHMPPLAQSALSLMVGIASIVFTVALARVLYTMVGVIVCVLFLAAPFAGLALGPEVARELPIVSLFTLLVVNQRATKELRAAGFKVGLMGGNPADVEASMRGDRALT